MSVPAKPIILEGHQIVLYRRPLHPALFGLRGRRVVRDNSHELEAWVLDGGHVLRFDYRGACVTEVAIDAQTPVPQGGVVGAFLCTSDRDYDLPANGDGIQYMTTVQTETLTENLYRATYEEMLELARETGSLAHRYTDDAGRCLSMVEIQRMAHEVHVHCTHMLAGTGTVLRIQSLFEAR
jgi:hypothetical protein